MTLRRHLRAKFVLASVYQLGVPVHADMFGLLLLPPDLESLIKCVPLSRIIK
jgi:hypothetical protein